MTTARFFLLAAACALTPTSAAAQAAGPYAAAIGQAHVAAARTSSRTVETTRAAATEKASQTKGASPATAATAAAATATIQPAVEAAPIASTGFTYNPEGRRDPFISLLRRGNDESAPAVGPRKPGLLGLGVSEVTLKGTMASRGGYIALLKGADAKTYIVRPGDRLLDGAVQAVTAGAVVILQRVDDPRSPQREREVRKMLRQTEEEAK